MNSVLRQLQQWRLREQGIRLAWGGGRWFAVVASVLVVACAIDWAVDRYSGSTAWRKALRTTRVLAPSDPLAVGHTPFGLRLLMTAGQLALAGFLGYHFVVRPLRQTPPVDDLALRAEKAFPEFDHRLVTAIQLNRPAAATQGMSKTLIAEVTREAGEIAARHNLLKLIDYRPVLWAGVAALPVLAVWLAFFAADPPLTTTLLRRQALADAAIPRYVHLENRTRGVWPTGSEVTVRYLVTGRFSEGAVGTLVVVPDRQPAEFYDLTFEKRHETDPEAAYFAVRLPASSLDFSFQARLGEGRTEEPGSVRFESPPQLGIDDPNNPPLTARQVLPAYLGLDPTKAQYVRKNDGWTRGEVIDALPRSAVIIDARFNKPVKSARLVRIEREGLQERDLPPIEATEMAPDRQSALFLFPTTPRMIGYRLELEDSLGFTNPTAIRRNVRMWEDRPPLVEFKPESTRDPNPEALDGRGNPKDYESEMPLGQNGVVQVIYSARSEVGVQRASIRYRVIPKGVQFDAYPEEYRAIQHPRDDPNNIVFDRLTLARYSPAPRQPDPGPFVPDLGLFRYAFTRSVEVLGFEFTVPVLSGVDQVKAKVEFYPFPSPNPAEEPGELEGGGRVIFEVGGLLKKLPEQQPDGKIVLRTAKLEVGDTVELYLEVFDKLPTVENGKPILGPDGKPLPPRPAGYTREAKRKIVLTDEDVTLAALAHLEAQAKLRDKLDQLAKDQFEVFKPKPK